MRNSWSEAKIHENEVFNSLHLRLPQAKTLAMTKGGAAKFPKNACAKYTNARDKFVENAHCIFFENIVK